jgi:hypothetical protein
LQRSQLLCKPCLLAVGFRGQLLPNAAFFTEGRQLCFGGLQFITDLGLLRLVDRHGLPQLVELGPQLRAFVSGCLWWNKGARPKVAVLESAVKPQAKLPAQLEGRQGCSMVAMQGMVGRVAGHANLIEYLSYFLGQSAFALQSANEVVLRLCGVGVQARARRQGLGQQL